MLTSFLSLPLRFLGATSRRPAGRRSPPRAILAVEWLERREVPAITFTPSTLPHAKFNASYTQALTGNGGTTPYHDFLIKSGALPAGLSLSGTGTISGTPTATGQFTFTVQATDSSSTPQTGTQNYTLTVDLALSPTSLPNAGVGKSYSQTITASGGTGNYHLTESGALPPHVTFKDNGNGTATISGTPTAGGSFRFTIQATDSARPTAATGSQSYTLTVKAITLSPKTLGAVVAGTSVSLPITAAGGTPHYTFSVSKGKLPLGLSLGADPKDTTGTRALITGTTHAAGRFTFTITAQDSSTGTGPFTGSRSYTLVVNPAHFVFLTQPGNAAVNANLPPFAVEALGQDGKPVTGQVTLTLITVVSEATARFKSGSTTKVTLANGVATFSNVAITARGRYVLKATIGSMSIFSDFFDIALNGRHSPGQ
jgi:hypothetical protein